jgi:hypothetical protein
MKRSQYLKNAWYDLRYALLEVLNFFSPPEQPAQLNLELYDQEMERLVMQRLQKRYTRDKAAVERQAKALQPPPQLTASPIEPEPITDQFHALDLAAFIKGMQHTGDMNHLWRWWHQARNPGERFTQTGLPAIGKQPQRK